MKRTTSINKTAYSKDFNDEVGRARQSSLSKYDKDLNLNVSPNFKEVRK